MHGHTTQYYLFRELFISVLMTLLRLQREPDELYYIFQITFFMFKKGQGLKGVSDFLTTCHEQWKSRWYEMCKCYKG